MKRSKATTGLRSEIAQYPPVALCRAWRKRITVCSVLASLWCSAIALAQVTLTPGITSGQPQDVSPGKPPAATLPTPAKVPADSPATSTGNSPSPETAMAAYRLMNGWVRAWDTTTGTNGPPLSAAAVTLRMNNRIVGRGKALAAKPEDAGVLRRAVADAIAETERRRPVSGDALGQSQRLSEAADISISLELAGEFVPFEPASFTEVDLVVQAGLEGVAVRIGDQFAAVFPAAMLLSGGSPADAVCGAISEVSGDPMLAIKTAAPSQPGALRQSHGVHLYRFAVTHIAQTSPQSQPSFLFRSGRLIEQRSINSTSLSALRGGIAANLRNRIVAAQDGDGHEVMQVVGSYAASRGPATASIANPETTSLVAIALRHHAASLPVDSPDREDFEWLGGEVARSAMRAQTPMSVVTAAAIVAAMASECAVNSESRMTFQPAFDVLLKSIDDKGVWDTTVPTDRRGLVAYGLAREAIRGGAFERAAPYRAKSSAAIVSVMKEASTTAMSENMPWLFFADRELRSATPTDPAVPEPSRTTAFLAFRDAIWNTQMTADDAGDEGPDLVGGFVFADPKS
ncbi:MAG: hypothetical protein PSX37_05765, partial [bacterium]|nr:hypothetical protein [bacterium]